MSRILTYHHRAFARTQRSRKLDYHRNQHAKQRTMSYNTLNECSTDVIWWVSIRSNLDHTMWECHACWTVIYMHTFLRMLMIPGNVWPPFVVPMNRFTRLTGSLTSPSCGVGATTALETNGTMYRACSAAYTHGRRWETIVSRLQLRRAQTLRCRLQGGFIHFS